MNEKITTLEQFVELLGVEYEGGGSAFDGLVIIAKYIENKRDIITAAEHDEIFSVGLEPLIEAGITIEDAKAIRVAGWGYDEDNDCLYHFV
jgi:hypothetical protein